MTPTQPEYAQVLYNGRRLRYLIYPAIGITIYYAVFLAFLRSTNLISTKPDELVKPDIVVPAGIQVVVLLFLALSGFIGIAQVNELKSRGSLVMLFLSTTLFILTICVPMYFWGGSHRSIFGPLLATVAGLTVAVAKTTRVRIIFGAACLVAFGLLSISYHDYFYREIYPYDGPISAGWNLTGLQVYAIFQTVAALLTILIAIYLSWRNAHDENLFGDTSFQLHILRKRATREQRAEMVLSSIKFAIDLERRIAAGGGMTYSACVDILVGDGSKAEHIWCVEWAAANREIIPGSLVNHTNISATEEIREAVDRLIKDFLPK